MQSSVVLFIDLVGERPMSRAWPCDQVGSLSYDLMSEGS
jgi:hypothetical protein